MFNPPEVFQHHQAAHCESGVTSNLLQNEKIALSEAMAFGLGSGIFFLYVPFVKVMGLPLTSYRSFPGSIFKKTCRRMGIRYEYRKFRDPMQGTRALNEYLSRGQAVGIRSNIYWLPYIPQQFRFQFNAHNLVVIGKASDDTYLVSDPILESVSHCPAPAMTRARFAKGILAPKGLIFFPQGRAADAGELPWSKAIHSSIQETVRRMLYTPLPMVGTKGIRFLSRQMRKWPKKLDLDKQKLYLANVVRMQEEIGTGGAGFRFLYAAFLQEAGEKLNSPVLNEASKSMTQVGNVWREFATLAAKFCKDRLQGEFTQIPDLLLKIADQEEAIYRDLGRRYL